MHREEYQQQQQAGKKIKHCLGTCWWWTITCSIHRRNHFFAKLFHVEGTCFLAAIILCTIWNVPENYRHTHTHTKHFVSLYCRFANATDAQSAHFACQPMIDSISIVLGYIDRREIDWMFDLAISLSLSISITVLPSICLSFRLSFHF